jgi:hypothetical protein
VKPTYLQKLLAHASLRFQGVTTPCSVDDALFSKFLVFLVVVFTLLTACCPPATTSGFQETAFTATFLGLSADGQYLLVQPERSRETIQMIYNNAESLTVGQRMYLVGRLEGNIIYVSNLTPL